MVRDTRVNHHVRLTRAQAVRLEEKARLLGVSVAALVRIAVAVELGESQPRVDRRF